MTLERRPRALADATIWALSVGFIVPLIGICLSKALVRKLLPLGTCLVCALYVAGLLKASWPLISYRMALYVSVLTAAPIAVVSILLFPMRTSRSSPYILLLGCSIFLTFAAAFFLFLCVATFVRRGYWPQFPPGHCSRCGYNLFGLPSPRCPECGSPSESKEPPVPDNGAPTN